MKVALYVARFSGEKIQHPPSLQCLAGYLLSQDLLAPEDLLFANTIEEILNFRPDVLGVGSVTQCIDDAVRVGQAVKNALPNCLTVLGGYHVSALPGSLPEVFDLGVIGEGEETFAEILRFKAGEPTFDRPKLGKINGICFYGQDREIVVTQSRKFIADIESFHPFRKIPYAQDWAYLFSARGCPYKCSYCASHRFWNSYRPYSAEYVVREIDELFHKFGVRNIYFVDDLFIYPKKRFRNIIELLKVSDLLGKIKFKGFIRINLVDEEVVQLLSEMGFSEVRFGMETASQKLLDKIKDQPFSVAKAEEVIGLCNRYKIPVCGSFMFGIPGETEEDIAETVRFLRKHKERFYIAGFYLLQPVPGSALWDDLHAAGSLAGVNGDFSGFSIDMAKDSFDWDNFQYFNHERISRLRFVEIMKRIKEEFVALPTNQHRERWILHELLAMKTAFELFIKRLCQKCGIDIRRIRRSYAKQVLSAGARLYVGCGEDSREGYVGCDVRDLPTVSIVCQAWEISSFVQRVSAIYSRHMLEHLTISQVEASLTDWLVALDEGGEIEIVVPNIDFHIQQIRHAQWNEKEWSKQSSNARHAFAGFWGWQRDATIDCSSQSLPEAIYWDVHKCGFNAESLEFFLKRSGFSSIECKIFDKVHLVARAKKKMDPRERQISPRIEGVRPDHRTRYELASKFIKPGYRILDVGCGIGYGSTFMADISRDIDVMAIDLSAEAIKYANQFYSRDNINYIVEDIFGSDIPSCSIDLVVCFEVIEHCHEDHLLAEKIWSFLKPGGLFLCSTPNQNVLTFDPDIFPYHRRHYTPNEFEELLGSAGFKIEAKVSQRDNISNIINDGWNGAFNIAVCKK